MYPFFSECVNVYFIKPQVDRVFMVCRIGQKRIENNGKIRNYLRSIEKCCPGATVIIGVSTFTNISSDLFNYHLKVNFQRFGNSEKGKVKSFFQGIRWCYYKEFLIEHNEIKYIIVSDDDTLFFKDPFSLLDGRENVVHLMYDPITYANKRDWNYLWTSTYVNHLSKDKKDKCGMLVYNGSLDTPELRKTLFYNSGLMVTTRESLLKISDMMCHNFQCPGEFKDNVDQGLLNYLLLTKQFDALNLELIGYNIDSEVLISCPEYFNLGQMTKTVNSSSLVAIHHYQNWNSRKKYLPTRIRELM